MKYHNLVSCMEGEADVIWPISKKTICYSEQQQEKRLKNHFVATACKKSYLKNSPGRVCFWTVDSMMLGIESVS